MKNIHIAFFTEAGTSRGMGHFIRSYTISEKFKSLGVKVSFFLDSDICFDDKFKDITYFKWKDFKLNSSYDIIFIDSYEADIDIYNTISNSCKVAVYIDDFKRFDYPKGVILNFAPDAKDIFYKLRDKKHTYLLGLKYIPIRDEFLNLKIEKKEQIFMMLGGNDVANLSLKLVDTLKNIMTQKIIVSNSKSVANSLKEYKNTRVLYKPSDTELVQAMASSSMAVSTASMSVYELAYLKIPTIIIAVAKNQEIGVSQFIKHDLACDFVSIKNNAWQDDINNKVKYLLNKKSYNSNSIIDGNGTKNIAYEILRLVN